LLNKLFEKVSSKNKGLGIKMTDEIKLGKYLHFKGKEYEVVGVAKHSETLEDFVVYYDSEKQLWIRPKEMFTETVERGDYSGPRFRFIGEKTAEENK